MDGASREIPVALIQFDGSAIDWESVATMTSQSG